MKCDLCRHEETRGKLLCKTCAEAISRLLRIEKAPAPADKAAVVADSQATVAGAMF